MRKYEGYALITGGSKGIGLSFAHQLAAQGYDLVLVARHKDELETVATDIKKKYKVDVVVIAQDLADLKSTDNIYDILKDKKIHVGLLVNNAGFAKISLFDKSDREQNWKMIQVMCLSLTDLTYKFLPAMLEKGSGGIIFLSSFVSEIATSPTAAVYAATKSFISKLGISLHTEYSNKGIDIITVYPGYVETNFYDESGISAPEIKMLTPDEIAEKTLTALGKEIEVFVLNDDRKLRVLLKLMKILPLKTIEKLTRKRIKERYDIEI